MRLHRLALSLTLIGCVLSTASGEGLYTPGEAIDKDFGGFAKPFLETHCVDCHGTSDPEGDLSLEDLGPVDEINAATWKSVWAQVTLEEMPPQDMDHPGILERLQLSDWIVAELTRVMRDKGGFQAHRDPNKGNFVNHDLLFGRLPEGIQLRPTSSPARIWRVTPEEHMTRLNELINTEPQFDPAKPGLRSHGDWVPTNHGGELKLYFGVDRIIKWQGGTVAYATAVKSVPAVLSSARNHGFQDYPDFYTVNSAEATQIMGMAGDIIRYMADGPLSIAEPYQITDDPKSIADKMDGDIRGLPTSLVYSTEVVRPITPVRDFMQEDDITDDRLGRAVDFLFEALTFRPPTASESSSYVTVTKQAIEKLGKSEGGVLGLSAIFLDRDALFRPELVEQGSPDQFGRAMLQDWELGLAVNHALRFLKPDPELRKAIVAGRMRTRADVKREVERILADESIRKPRILSFFRDYFDYDLGGYICKDLKSLAATGVETKGVSHYRAMFDATASTDRLIEMFLREDREVLYQLLTTDKVVATKKDSVYFGQLTSNEERKVLTGTEIQATKTASKADVKTLERDVAELTAELEAATSSGDPTKALKKALREKKKALIDENRIAKQKRQKKNRNQHDITPANLSGPKMFARVSHRSFGSGSMKPERILATVPEGQRIGILTHPSWLVSHSDAMDNHAIRRGRWIHERLLGGGIPDVPITVDAMLPDEPENTLRQRMRVTRQEYCWTCHKKMDPLGLPFEIYNHAGVYRDTELGQPVDASGEIIESGDPSLDGKVADAIELIEKLAQSERVEQVFVRHAFRFWMGRNETLNDAPVLQDAYRAYKLNGGSMKALLTSLLTSDAFLYRDQGL